jgi:hypothetical protein
MDLMVGCYTAHEDSWRGYVRVEAHKLSLWSRRRDDDHQWELSRIIELDKDSSGPGIISSLSISSLQRLLKFMRVSFNMWYCGSRLFLTSNFYTPVQVLLPDICSPILFLDLALLN